MEVVFLGTGSAWAVPEHGCECRICRAMAEAGEERTRTALFIEASEKILVDPGPDIRRQMIRAALPRPDVVLITHEHLDHLAGLDELLCFRRAVSPPEWRPLPLYAHPAAWPAIKGRFGYLFPSLLEERQAQEGQALKGPKTRITPFKTAHGPVAKGSVGYVFEWRGKKIVYTSDFLTLEEEPERLERPDLLILQSHFFNEPERNRPHHMSLQAARPYIARWRPARIVLVHISSADWVPGDPANHILKKLRPKNPLKDAAGRPWPVPLTTDDWARLAPQVLYQAGLEMPIEPAREGMRLRV